MSEYFENKPIQAPQYYVTDMAKASFSEIFRGALRVSRTRPAGAIGFVVILASKLLGFPFRSGRPFTGMESQLIGLNLIPDDVRRLQESLTAPLLFAGFAPVIAIENKKSKSEAYSIVMRSSDGLIVANVVVARTIGTVQGLVRTALVLSSQRRNGLIMGTTNKPRGIPMPPEIEMLYLSRASPENVISRHRERILNLDDVEFISVDDVPPRIEKRISRFMEFQINRGYMVPATEQELRKHGLLA